MIIEDRYLDALRGHRSPQEHAVQDLWTGEWVAKGLDSSSAATIAREANERLRLAAERQIATVPGELDLELLLAIRAGQILEHNAWSWRFYERMGNSHWRTVPPDVKRLLWHWRQRGNIATRTKSIFDEVNKPIIGCFHLVTLSPIGAAWLDTHYPNG